MPKYAIIENGMISNVIVADPSFILVSIQDPKIAVNIDNEYPEPQIGWSYDGIVFSAPTRTLAQAKADKISSFGSSVKAYMNCYFDLDTRQSMSTLYFQARLDGLTNRSAYLQPMVDWANSIISYSRSFVLQVQALTDVNDVDAILWDIQGNVSNPPAITLAGAISIEN